MNRLLILSIGAASSMIVQAQESQPSSNYLWYRQPADVKAVSLPWKSDVSVNGSYFGNLAGASYQGSHSKDSWESRSLPVGNGRVGGTIFGGDVVERVNLNEVSLWSGGPNLPGNGSGYAYGPKANSNQFGNYQPFGNLYIEFNLPGQTESYTRSLDLRDGIARVEFTNDGVKHERECFVSEKADVFVYTAKADKEGALNARIGLLPYHDVKYSTRNGAIIMSGTLANGQEFEGAMQLRIKGGKKSIKGDGGELTVTYEGQGKNMMPQMDAEGKPYFDVRKADSFDIIISLATNYEMSYEDNWKGKSPTARNNLILKKIQKKSVAALRKGHIAHYRKLFRRLSINLGKTPAETAQLPTDERVKRFRNSDDDPELISTIYQYGRYVLISGSRPGNLPVNLQGIWNDKVHAPWASDYHNNINLQMCYWGAEVANLSECHMPLLNFIKAMEAPLTKMTQKHFGEDIKGWTTRISQNPWGGGGWTHWNPPVNAWYALHLWDHYTFTHDKKYLAEHAYPILKNICHFWETRLKVLGDKGEGLISAGKPLTVADHPELADIKKGALVSPQGWSHEWGPVEDGCMHDQQLIDELFQITVKAANILDRDSSWAASLEKKRLMLVPNRIGSGGYLQEWIVDRPNMVHGQRHTSHLIGVYPGSTITMARTPDLAKAAMKSLELRGLSGDNRRSWTWPWRTALWARFREPEQAYSMVCHYIRYNLLDNLFGNHPPMQMDGTFGMTGGMSEIFIQSHAGIIELLPALPKAWPNGEIKGIKARGNITVDFSWKDGKVTDYSLTTTDSSPKAVELVVNGEKTTVTPQVKAKGSKAKKAKSKKKK